MLAKLTSKESDDEGDSSSEEDLSQTHECRMVGLLPDNYNQITDEGEQNLGQLDAEAKAEGSTQLQTQPSCSSSSASVNSPVDDNTLLTESSNREIHEVQMNVFLSTFQEMSMNFQVGQDHVSTLVCNNNDLIDQFNQTITELETCKIALSRNTTHIQNLKAEVIRNKTCTTQVQSRVQCLERGASSS